MVDSTSRPWSSVPSGKVAWPRASQAGGVKAFSRSSEARSKGSCGATQGANRAAPTHSSVASAAATVTGERRKL
jgi:hypothetical protein